jgi:hypothetical protein
MAKLLVKQVRSKINCPLKKRIEALAYVNGTNCRAWFKPYNPWDDKQS